MSRDPRYQKLLNSKRWKMIRAEYLRQHPLCERCQREGFVRSAVDVHHKRPVESAKTEQEMERLAYNLDGNNLEALCIPCHIKTHQEMRSHTKEKVRENKARARRRFMEANDPNWRPDGDEDKTPRGSF
jgi:5-methylcytosine-specific restriction protein A